MKYKNSGFTIVELLIATTILSVILTGASFVVVQVGRMYHKGVIMTRTQDTARNVVEALSRPIQLDNAVPEVTVDASGEVTTVCIGNQRYSIATDKIVGTETNHALWRDERTSDCSSVNLNSPGTSGQDLLPPNMRLNKLSVEMEGTDMLWAITVDITYGERDLTETDGSCKGGVAGGQFCARAQYSTTVARRVKTSN